MKVMIESADLDVVKNAFSTGVVDGIWTNPSLLKQAGQKQGFDDVKKYLKELLKSAGDDRLVSLCVTETEHEAMKSEVDKLLKLFKKYKSLVVSVPVSSDNTLESLKLIRHLASEGVKVNASLVMTPEQAVLAAKAGASIVTVEAGAVDDFIRESKIGMTLGRDYNIGDYFPEEGMEDYDDEGNVSGIEVAWKTAELFKLSGFKADLFVSSRNPRQVSEAGLAGAKGVIVSMDTLSAMVKHSRTVSAANFLNEDALQKYKDLLKDTRRFAINLTKE